MKYIFLHLSLLYTFALAAQSPEPIYSITKKQKDYSYYSQQAELWQAATKKSPSDAAAWMNYYNAARMNNMFAGETGDRYDLEPLVDQLKANLPNTFEYHYITFARGQLGEQDYEHLRKAYALNPDRYETWDAFINEAIFKDDWATVKKFNEKWRDHYMYSPGLTNWNYNALVGLDPDAVLITFGDNDTYPLWLLQTLHDMRTDVTVLNASLALHPPYQKMIFEKLNIPNFDKSIEDFGNYPDYRDAMLEHILLNLKRPAYVGISMPSSFREKHQDKLYLVGLTYKFSLDDFDHVAVLRKNFEQHFLKDYLKVNLTNDFCQSVVDHINQQYIPALTVLYKHYRFSGESDKRTEVKKLLLGIAERSDREASVNAFLTKFED
jgi:hypothetical protein